MLRFFTDPYENESLNSVFARYHYYSGNINKHATGKDLLNVDYIRNFDLFPNNLNFLEKQLHYTNYTSEQLIFNNTLFPLYSTFLIRQLHKPALESMKLSGDLKIKKIFKIKGQVYKYCPSCFKEDIKRYGEAYFHRNHQIQELQVCSKHRCKLYDYHNLNKDIHSFTMLNDMKRINTKEEFFDYDLNIELVKVSRAVDYILNINEMKYSKREVFRKLMSILIKTGYTTESGFIRHKDLNEEMKEYYGQEFFNLLNLESDKSKEKYMLTNTIFKGDFEILDPIRTIVLILFLSRKIEIFFNNIENNIFKPKTSALEKRAYEQLFSIFK